MAIDVYLQIDGIKGESADSNHQGWIELTSASWGVIQPRSATASTAGGHTAERCEHRSLAVTKLADLASPILMQTCSMGKTIRKQSLNSCAPTATANRSSITKWNLKMSLSQAWTRRCTMERSCTTPSVCDSRK